MRHTSYWCDRCNNREKQPERICDLHSSARELLEAAQIAESVLDRASNLDALRNESEELVDEVNRALKIIRNAINLATKGKNEI